MKSPSPGGCWIIARRRGWTVCGDYVCEVLTEFNVFDGDKRGMFLRLQVPVKF